MWVLLVLFVCGFLSAFLHKALSFSPAFSLTISLQFSLPGDKSVLNQETDKFSKHAAGLL